MSDAPILRQVKILKLIFLLTFLIIFSTVRAQNSNKDLEHDLSFYKASSHWFSAWELLSTEIYKIEKVRPVEFVFFDDRYVYSTSPVTIKNGSPIKGPGLMNLKLQWKKQLHKDSITLPENSVIPVNLMSFAGEIPNDSNRSFFVMPLPGFWKNSGVSSKELGLENLVTGVFIHEFSHSQQFQNFGKKMTQYEQQNNFGVEFSDDVIQNIFSKDTVYKKIYKKETELFYGSIKANDLIKTSLKEAIAIMKQRQKTYFQGPLENLAQIDNFFLTMEGLGQYSMYKWLIHPNGGKIEKDIAIQGVRRGGRWWSQDQGFALFLILDKLSPPDIWAKEMFGNKTESVIDLIENLMLPKNNQ